MYGCFMYPHLALLYTAGYCAASSVPKEWGLPRAGMRRSELFRVAQLARQTYRANDQHGAFAARCMASQVPYKPTENDVVSIVRKRGLDVLHDPIHNSEPTVFPMLLH